MHVYRYHLNGIGTAPVGCRFQYCIYGSGAGYRRWHVACQHPRRRTRYSLGEAAADIARKSNRYSTTASFALRGGSTVIQMREVRSRTEGQSLSLTKIIAREAVNLFSYKSRGDCKNWHSYRRGQVNFSDILGKFNHEAIFPLYKRKNPVVSNPI